MKNDFSQFPLCAFKRDFTLEKFTIKASRLELFLRNTWGTPRMQSWLNGFQDGDNFRCHSGLTLELKVPQDRIPYRYSSVHGAEYPDDIVPVIPQEFLEAQPGSEPGITQHYWSPEDGRVCAKYNGSNELQTPFLMIRFYGLDRPMQRDRDEIIRNHDHSGISLGQRLLLYDSSSVNYLSKQFNISNALSEQAQFEGCTQWQRVFIDPAGEYSWDANIIPFRETDGSLAFMLELVQLENGSLLLPVSFYQYRDFPAPLRLYIPPKPPFTLFNSDKVAATPGATVIFTDELGIATCEPQRADWVHCSYYGGDEAIPHLDFGPLQGRRITWLMLDRPESKNERDKYITAIKIAQQLYGRNCHVEFADFTGVTWTENRDFSSLLTGTTQGVKLLSQDEMVQNALIKGVYVPEELREEESCVIEGDALEKLTRPPFLISPIAREGTGIAIYGGPGTAKSWLAISIVLAAANGKAIFPDRWNAMNPDGVKCLTIAGEMSSGEYGERVKRLIQYYGTDEAHKKNFILHSACQLDLASPDGLEKLHQLVNEAEQKCGTPGQPVKLVILDNLTTLSAEGENPANFGRIEFSLKSLKKRGIVVILIHHENQKGEIRGARKISDVMDQKLHLFKANDGDKIGVIIKNEKIRSGKNSEFTTFKAMLDVEAKGTGWEIVDLNPDDLELIGEETEDDDGNVPSGKVAKTKYGLTAWEWLSDDERIESVKKQRLQGLTNIQIAVNHSTSKTTVCEFRKMHNIRDCDLRNQGFEVGESEE